MLYARVEHKGVVGVGIYILLAVTSCFMIRRYCWMKRPEPTLHDRVHETGSTDMLLHIGGWRVSVSPTLVESSLTKPGPC